MTAAPTTVEVTQAAMVAALAHASGGSLLGTARAMGLGRGTLHTALGKGPLPRVGHTAATCTAEAVAAALGVPVDALLPGGVVVLRVAGGEP